MIDSWFAGVGGGPTGGVHHEYAKRSAATLGSLFREYFGRWWTAPAVVMQYPDGNRPLTPHNSSVSKDQHTCSRR